jgi:hypothetical protein
LKQCRLVKNCRRLRKSSNHDRSGIKPPFLLPNELRTQIAAFPAYTLASRNLETVIACLSPVGSPTDFAENF